MSDKPVVDIWVDGSTYPKNPGNAGWGAVLEFSGVYVQSRVEAAKFIPGDEITNNQAEITAATKAIELLTKSCSINLISDSTYFIGGAKRALAGNPYKTNTEFFQEFVDVVMVKGHDINFVHVKGHNGNENNERAHDLAYEAATRKNPEVMIKHVKRKNDND